LHRPEDVQGVLRRYSNQVLGQAPAGDVLAQLDWAYEVVQTNPCLRLLPGYDNLVERTRPIGEGVLRIANFANYLYVNRTELFNRVRDYVSGLLRTLPACGEEVWREFRGQLSRLARSSVGVLGAVGSVVLAGFEATFLSLIDMLREKTLGEWAEDIGNALLDIIWPWPRIGDAIVTAFRAGGEAIGNLLRLEFGGAGTKLLDVVRGILDSVDLLGGYIYVGLIGLPALIGSVFPAAGTAAGAAIGQKINSVLAVVLGIVETVVSGLQALAPLGRLIDLIIRKANEIEEDSNDDDAEGREPPEIELTEEELNQAAADFTELLFKAAPAVVQLALSVAGTALRTLGRVVLRLLKGARDFARRVLERLRRMFRIRRGPRMPRMRMMPRMMPQMMRGSDARPQCRTRQQGQQRQPGAQTPRAPQAPQLPRTPQVPRARVPLPIGRRSCFVAGTLAWLGTGKRIPIENVKVGDRVLTFRGTPHTARELHHWQSWSKVTLRVEVDGQAVSEVVLLKPQSWMAEHQPVVGMSIYLDMPEMGVQDAARVVSIEPCPAIQPGPGRVVTATFKHLGALVHQLWIKDEPKPIGVTGTHPFWSVDRQMWVEATQLRIGERVETVHGTTEVMARSVLSPVVTVHNIEVEGDHCYRVGEQGMLVHNISQSDCRRDPSRASNPCSLPSTAFCQAHHVIPCETWDEPAATRIHECCFDLNGPDNLIMLPCCDYPNRTAAYHTGRTPSTYVASVRTSLRQLNLVTDPDLFCAGARAILLGLKTSLCSSPMFLNRTTNIQSCSGARPCSARCT
jgi:hypothetical protein